jgi:hypothetical protein
VVGEVIGRQPFGVFLRVEDIPEAIGLAEITDLPQDAVLPLLGTRVPARSSAMSRSKLWSDDHLFKGTTAPLFVSGRRSSTLEQVINYRMTSAR